MKQTIHAPNTVPTANIAVNKSRLKLYTKAGDTPTYYLQKGQEFQIELFNPTTSCVLAKITLNNKPISQGGLVLNPGQRVFLDRYLDVAKKFMFDTYEVSNTAEVKKAIENNGDIKIEFFSENIPYTPPINQPTWINHYHYHNIQPLYRQSNPNTYGPVCGTINNVISGTNLLNNTVTTANNANTFTTYDSNANSIADAINSLDISSRLTSSPLKNVRTKTIETGRIEQGSYSNQEFKTVSKDFNSWAFHTIEYKLLPISQKINTTNDINVKKYCTNCGAKVGKTDRFCSSCGHKA